MALPLRQQLWQLKNVVITFLFPLLLLPLPLLAQNKEAACAYILLLTAAYWISEAIPLGAAAMVPAFLFPLFGIMKSSEPALDRFDVQANLLQAWRMRVRASHTQVRHPL